MSKYRLGTLLLIGAYLLGTIGIIASGGGGGEDPGDTQIDPCLQGFGVSIDTPTYEADYSVSQPLVQIGGNAPLASNWDACYPCVPDTSGVEVDWTNQATGVSGVAFSWIRIGWFFGWPIYTHKWNDFVDLQTGVNLINVYAYEASTRVGSNCIRVTYTPDTAAPSIPANLQATPLSASVIALSWEAAVDDATTDDAGVSYRIYRDGNYLITVGETIYDDTWLAGGTAYCYAISAIDTAGNESTPSAPVCAVTPDLVAPSTPTELKSIVLPAGHIDLYWTASTDDLSVTGYRVLRDGTEIATTVQPSYTDTSVDVDSRYCYRVLAYDQPGNESPLSNESCSNTRWKLATVDGISSDIGLFSDIAAASTGGLYIAYFDSAAKDLKYASNTAGSWVTTTVASSGITGEYPAIALDINGSAHITYYEYGDFGWVVDNLMHATNASGAWTTETVESGGWFNDLVIDAQGHLHASYRNSGLRHVTNASGSWQSESVAMPDFWLSIAVDATDHLHISSYQGYPANDLIYTTNATGVWVAEPVDTDHGGEFNSLALDENGKAHVSYCEYFGGLRYATNASGSWVSVPVDDARCGYTSLALDADGHAHISYVGDGQLMYASNASGDWLLDSIDAAESTEGNYYAYATALAIDTVGDVHISYYAPGRKLGYATTR